MTARLTAAEAVGFFVAAIQAVLPEGGLDQLDFHSGQELWDWMTRGALMGELTETEKQTVQQVLDGMLRERLVGVMT
jgi:uncharacterized protein (UPF0261 family)